MRSKRRKLYTKYRLEVAKEAGRGDRCRLRTDRMKRGAGPVHAVPKARLSAAACVYRIVDDLSVLLLRHPLGYTREGAEEAGELRPKRRFRKHKTEPELA